MSEVTPTVAGDDELQFVAHALRAEADVVERIAGRASSGADAESWRCAIDLLEGCTGHVVVSGMGKSGLVGAKISATFSSLGQPSSVLHPSEAVHGDLGRVQRGDVVILLSYSGETSEVVDLALILKADGMPTLGISSHDGTSLAGACMAHLSVGDLTEACPMNLAPTASTTAQLAIGDALALAVARRRDFTADDFHKSHPGGLLGAGLRRVSEVLRFRAGDNLPVLSQDLTVKEALEQARPKPGGRRAGAIILVDPDGRMAGIFTDADLRRLIVEDLARVESTSMRDVMTVNPKCLPLDAIVSDAVRLVREHRLDEIPVVDERSHPVGLIDVQDLMALKVVSD